MAIPVMALDAIDVHPLLRLLAAGLVGSSVYLVVLVLLGDSLALDLVGRLRSVILKFRQPGDAGKRGVGQSPGGGAE
jgi:hypothetical protein